MENAGFRPPRQPWRRLILMVLPVAAIAVAVLLLRPDAQTPVESGALPMRGEDGRTTLFAPMGDLDQLPGRFSWPAYAGAARYRFELYDADMAERHVEITSSLSLELPAVAVPAEGHWRVVPLLEGNTEVRPGPMLSYRVR